MHPLPPERTGQHGVFTLAQARSAGWTPSALVHAVQSRRIVRVQRGCYATPSELDAASVQGRRESALRRSIAAALGISNAMVSHQPAALHYGLPVLGARTRSCITIPPGCQTHAHGLHLHRRQTYPGERLQHGAFAVSSVPRACLDIAAESGVAAGLVTADAALAAGLISRTELGTAWEHLRGVRGTTAARQVCEHADPRSESPLESISRYAFLTAPEFPELQAWVFDLSGRPIARVDFLWRQWGIVGEADGRIKYGDLADGSPETPLWWEKQRQEALTELGLVVFRWGWREAMNPPQLLAKLDRTIRYAQTLRTAGIPAAYYSPAGSTIAPLSLLDSGRMQR